MSDTEPHQRTADYIVGFSAFTGALLSRLSRGLPPFDSADPNDWEAEFRSWFANPDTPDQWCVIPPEFEPPLHHLVCKLHAAIRTTPAETAFWESVALWIPGSLPTDVFNDLLARNIAIDAVGHRDEPDAHLWRLADRVEEALLTLAKRRYASPDCTDDQLEEVLFNFPDSTWMLSSLAAFEGSSARKVELVATYAARSNHFDQIRRNACEPVRQAIDAIKPPA